MIELQSNLPANVVAIACRGQVTKADYETVLIPAVDRALAANRKLRLYYQIGADFIGFDPGAMWDDFKVGMEHLTRWERVAVVTDIDWIKQSTRLFGFLIPADTKSFALSEAAEARAWIVAEAATVKQASPDRLSAEVIAPGTLKIIAPEKLKADDFDGMATQFDAVALQHGQVKLLIDGSACDGWDSLKAFEHHMGFVHSHQAKAARIALIAGHHWQHWLASTIGTFLHPNIKVFDKGEEAKALRWLEE